jgi:hypothetical protein
MVFDTPYMCQINTHELWTFILITSEDSQLQRSALISDVPTTQRTIQRTWVAEYRDWSKPIES